MNFRLYILLICLLLASQLSAQITKKQVTKNIESWYKSHPEKYSISLTDSTTKAVITSYYPDRKYPKNNLIRLSHKGMKITLAFKKPLYLISTNKDSLQKYFNYIAIDDIYNDIPAEGWSIYPETPSSSLRGKGVQFTAGGNAISLVINWSTYIVLGYKDTEECNNARQVADSSIKESCIVFVRKRLPLEILVNQISID